MKEEAEGSGKRFHESVQHLKEGANQFGDRAQESFNEGWREFRNRASVYQGEANEFLDELAKKIKENPQQSALVAGAVGVGVGLVLGLMMRGRRR